MLSAQIEDMAFAQFIMNIQQSLDDEHRLTAFDVITLNNIRQGFSKKMLDKNITSKLLKDGYIESRGKTSGVFYILSREYYELSGNIVEYSKKSDWDVNQAFSMVSMFLSKHKRAKMGDFANLFNGHLSRKQTRTFVQKMVETDLLTPKGEGNGRYYSLSSKYEKNSEILAEVIKLGFEEFKKKLKGPEKDQ